MASVRAPFVYVLSFGGLVLSQRKGGIPVSSDPVRVGGATLNQRMFMDIRLNKGNYCHLKWSGFCYESLFQRPSCTRWHGKRESTNSSRRIPHHPGDL